MLCRFRRSSWLFLATALVCALPVLGATPAWCDDAVVVQNAESDAGEGSSSRQPEDDGPVPLNSEGNVINDGQVSDTSFLYDAAIADLAGADSYYDGQLVQVRGEAVGEAIDSFAGDSENVWVTLYDSGSGSSVCVVMNRSDADKIDMYGAYGKTGSRLRVQGVYNLACSEHEGESDIHAKMVVVEESGFEHPDRFDGNLFVPGVLVVVLGSLLMIIFFYARERAR